MVFIYLLYLYIRIYAIHEIEICAKNKTITGLQRFKVSNFRDGKIFVYNVTRVVKIRTGEEDYDALQDVE